MGVLARADEMDNGEVALGGLNTHAQIAIGIVVPVVLLLGGLLVFIWVTERRRRSAIAKDPNPTHHHHDLHARNPLSAFASKRNAALRGSRLIDSPHMDSKRPNNPDRSHDAGAYRNCFRNGPFMHELEDGGDGGGGGGGRVEMAHVEKPPRAVIHPASSSSSSSLSPASSSAPTSRRTASPHDYFSFHRQSTLEHNKLSSSYLQSIATRTSKTPQGAPSTNTSTNTTTTTSRRPRATTTATTPRRSSLQPDGLFTTSNTTTTGVDTIMSKRDRRVSRAASNRTSTQDMLPATCPSPLGDDPTAEAAAAEAAAEGGKLGGDDDDRVSALDYGDLSRRSSVEDARGEGRALEWMGGGGGGGGLDGVGRKWRGGRGGGGGGGGGASVVVSPLEYRP
jgi:hypothetical protein